MLNRLTVEILFALGILDIHPLETACGPDVLQVYKVYTSQQPEVSRPIVPMLVEWAPANESAAHALSEIL